MGMAGMKQQWVWQCQECQRECVPIRAESRCMCGHRLKDHIEGHSCSKPSCSCPEFVFIVAEGSWVLRCRCKHRHTEHASAAPHICAKAACGCKGFMSPWVCNCDHPWEQHQQMLVERQVLRVADIIAHQQDHKHRQENVGVAPPNPAETAVAGTTAETVRDGELLAEVDLSCEVNRWELVQRGKHQ